jgi:hypothetical protein
MRKVIPGLSVVFASSIARAQDAQVDRVLAKYSKFRPSEAELAMYSLDWADSLSQVYPGGVMERTNQRTKKVYAIKDVAGELTLASAGIDDEESLRYSSCVPSV